MAAPNGPSWRGSGGSSGGRNDRSWRRPSTETVNNIPLQSKFLKSLLGLGSTLLSIAAIVGFVYLIFVPGCNQTDVIVMAPAPYYDARMPPHPFGEQDRNEFSERFGGDRLKERLEAAVTKKLKNRGPWRSVQILYVSALAGQYMKEEEQSKNREPGKRVDVVLYDTDATPDEPEGRFSLDELLSYLEKQPRDLKKIVFIDLARGPTDWRWGQFTRPVVGAGLFEDACKRIPNLAIMTSCAPGELSWTSPSLGHSVFTHFLVYGMLGDADGNADSKRDGRIQLDELYQYVLKQTNQWVIQNRHFRGQHPRIFMSAESMNSAVVMDAKKQQKPSRADVDGNLSLELVKLWEEFDTWSKQAPEQWCPLEWYQFREHLHRAEQWRMVGHPDSMKNSTEAAQDAIKSVSKLNEKRNAAAASETFVAQNMTRRSGSKPVVKTSPLLAEQQLDDAFGRYAPPSLMDNAKKEILNLRTRAELESWQQFRTRLWTGTLLVDANRHRRNAEDLAFVGSPDLLEESKREVQEALAVLNKHTEIVKHVSNAQRIHRRLLAELPCLADWAAQRIPGEDRDSTPAKCHRAILMEKYSNGITKERFNPPSVIEQEKLRDDNDDDTTMQRVEIDLLLLFQQTRELAAMLDLELEDDSSALQQRIEAIKSLSESADKSLESLIARLRSHGDELTRRPSSASGTTGGQPQYFNWLKLRNALQWSGHNKDTRRQLFEALINTDKTLETNAQKESVAQKDGWNGDDWTGVDGCWSALWALQSLSLGGNDTAMHKRWVTWKSAVIESERQYEWLVQLGQSVRAEYQLRVDRAQEPMTDGMTIEQAYRTMLKSERALRTLHGYDAARFPVERDPTKRLEDFDTGALCLRQAEQYLEDFWGPVFPAPEPWYVLAIRECTRTARSKSDQLAVRLLKEASDKIETRMQDIEKNAKLTVKLPVPAIRFGLEKERSIQVGATMSDQVPRGTAALSMIAIEPDPSEPVLELPKTRSRITREITESEFRVSKKRVPPTANCDSVPVRAQLLFRARMWDEERDVVQVNACPPVSVDEEYRSPAATGEIVVTGIDRRNTIFIMDCSKSMNAQIDPANNPAKTRFTEGRSKLAQAIKQLNNIGGKDPYVIGLMAYGHRADLHTDGTTTIFNESWPSKPVDWNDTELLVKPSPLRGLHFSQINAYLDEDPKAKVAGIPLLGTFGITPSLGAIDLAASELIRLKQGGVIMLICDGSYSDEGKLQRVTGLLKQNPNISLQIVGYGIEKPDQLVVLRDLAKETNGEVFDAPDGNRLAEVISSLMKPRPFSVIRDAPPQSNMPAELNSSIKELFPGDYKVRFPGLPDLPVKIRGGERLEFKLDLPLGKLVHSRPGSLVPPGPKLFRRAQGMAPFSQREPDRFGYLKAVHNQDLKNPIAEFQFSLDRYDLLQDIVERPAEIRFRVTPLNSTQLYSRSWELLPNASIPAWKLTVKDWPINGLPVVQARWKMTRTEPDEHWPLTDLQAGPKKVKLPGDLNIEVRVEPQPGELLVQLKSLQPTGVDLTDVRVELGTLSDVQSKFLLQEYQWKSRFYEKEQSITYIFNVGEAFDLGKMRVGITSAASMDNEARTLDEPLKINKWDEEK